MFCVWGNQSELSFSSWTCLPYINTLFITFDTFFLPFHWLRSHHALALSMLQVIFCSCIIITAVLCENGKSVPITNMKTNLWKSNNKSVIELGYRKVSWFVRVLQNCKIVIFMINHDIALRVRSQSYGNILLNLKTILIFPKPFDFPRRKVLVSSHSYLVIMNNVSLYLEWCSEETKISIYSGGVPVRLWYKNSLERKNPNRDFVTMFVSLRARYYVFFFFEQM